jgi:cytochrome c556
MIFRSAFAVIALVAGMTAAVAQQEAVEARKDLMSDHGRQFYGVLGRMQRGQEPYDQAKVDAAFAALAADATKVSAAFATKAMPEKRSDYDASPKIWENKADFDAKAAAFVKAVTDNRGTAKNLDTLKVAYQAVGNTCNACHENYRVKN